MNFYYARSGQLEDPCSIVIPRDSRFDRLSAALEVRPGAAFRVAVEGIGRGLATIRTCDGETVRAGFELTSAANSSPEIDLLLAIPRPKVLRRLIPRITAMGIRSLTLLNACGVKREYFDTHWLDKERLAGLVMLGLEQGGACRYPDVRVCKLLKPFLVDSAPEFCLGADRVLSSLNGARKLPVSIDARRVVIAVGPETGWTDYEEQLFRDAGFSAYCLGEEHLPCDVAAIGMVAVVKASVSG